MEQPPPPPPPPLELQRLRWQLPEVEDIRLQPHGRTFFFFLIILFLLIVFTTLLFFFWIRRRRRSVHQSTTSSTHHDPPPPRGLGISAINGIPVIILGGDDNDGLLKCSRECCICLGGFEEGEKLKVLPPCCHAFHGECVDRWLRSDSTCPLCRASLGDESNSDSIKIVVVADLINVT